MKLEAGKTYVFKDDAARYEYIDRYIDRHEYNKFILKNLYVDGFTIDFVKEHGGAMVDGMVVFNDEIYHLFKESKLFDISEHEFDDCDISGVESCGATGNEHLKLLIEETNELIFDKQDAIAIAKHFKLI
tara:strand:- start:215 stop:604 length:390 start_codon:yes stop_codon:yes gene_type:complete